MISPFDLLESRMMFIKKDITMYQTARRAIRNHGYLSLYDGLSAQILRQLTYSTLRFHFYHLGKQHVDESNFLHKAFVATVAGILAGLVGIPTEVINTRMHVDRAVKKQYRRNYRHVFDGISTIYRKEGVMALYKGGLFSCLRAVAVTIGQNAVYDQSKEFYMGNFQWTDAEKCLHLLSSLTAAVLCTPFVQPIEVIRTVQMSASPSYLSTRREKMKFLMRFGIRGLFRGISPSLWRMIPSTILMFIFYEQLRLNFGYYETSEDK